MEGFNLNVNGITPKPQEPVNSVFTDDDFKRLKDHPEELDMTWLRSKGPILAARLEAAEDAVHQAYRCTPENKEYYNIWRKAAGK